MPANRNQKNCMYNGFQKGIKIDEKSLRIESRMLLYKIFEPIGVPSRSCPNLILHLCTKMTNEHRLSKLKKGAKILSRIRLSKKWVRNLN